MNKFKGVMTGILTISLIGFATASYANGEYCNQRDALGNFPIDIVSGVDEAGSVDCVEYRDPPPRGNNGWGNGDDEAPGGSLENNNAENYEGTVGFDGTEGGTAGPGNSTSNGNQGG